jgi:hypothetical protein
MIIMAVSEFSTLPSFMGLAFLLTRLQPHIKLAIFCIATILITLLGFRMIFCGLSCNGWIQLGRLW